MFVIHRCFVTESAVESLTVIKDFDVFEDGGACLRQVVEGLAMDQLGFESAPKRFDIGIVVAVAATAHAREDLVSVQ